MEARVILSEAEIAALFPPHATNRIVLSHTRPELLTGVLRRIDTGRESTTFLGFNNRGGTLDTFGMLFANRCTWAHVLSAAAGAARANLSDWLSAAEIAAVEGHGDPQVLRWADKVTP
jgi:phosphoketolase